jgi:hypothetical protein
VIHALAAPPFCSSHRPDATAEIMQKSASASVRRGCVHCYENNRHVKTHGKGKELTQKKRGKDGRRNLPAFASRHLCESTQQRTPACAPTHCTRAPTSVFGPGHIYPLREVVSGPRALQSSSRARETAATPRRCRCLLFFSSQIVSGGRNTAREESRV